MLGRWRCNNDRVGVYECERVTDRLNDVAIADTAFHSEPGALEALDTDAQAVFGGSTGIVFVL